MSDLGFLSNVWRDLFTVGSTLITVVGFLLTLQQIRRTRSVAIAAREAADRAALENRRNYGRFVLSNILRYLSESRVLVENKRWDLASLRLGDLADQVAQLADEDGVWKDHVAEIRRWEAQLRRQSERPTSNFASRKWDAFVVRFRLKVDDHHGPFKGEVTGDRA